jgi:hypothetical protein
MLVEMTPVTSRLPITGQFAGMNGTGSGKTSAQPAHEMLMAVTQRKRPSPMKSNFDEFLSSLESA